MSRPFPTDRLPDESIDLLDEGVNRWEEAVDFAADEGLHDVDYLTDVVFFAHHPRRKGRPLKPSESKLMDEWKSFRKEVAAIVAASQRADRVNAILIVPNQGHGRTGFLAVARKLKRELYRGRAEVVKATVPSKSKIGVALEIDRGGPFAWKDYSGLKTIMVISHAGICSGPNLDHDGSGEQPWGVPADVECTDEAALKPAGVKFWRKVGKALGKTGKTIILSCHCGENNYASLVAEATGHTVFAANGDFAAAHGGAALSHARKMEAGRPTNIFKKFTP